MAVASVRLMAYKVQKQERDAHIVIAPVHLKLD
jgi:hypothetical protein